MAAFKYHGAKQKMVNDIIPLIPKHLIWTEVFCGSATVTLSKPKPSGIPYIEIINDINQWIFNFFNVLKDPEKYNILLHQLTYTLYAQDEVRWAHNVMQCKDNTYTDIEKARAFFLKCQCGYGGSLAGKNQIGASKVDTMPRFRLINYVNNKIPQVINRIKEMYIYNEDAIKCMKKWDSPQTCHYVDPPYPETSQASYKTFNQGAIFTQLDFQNLVDTLENLKGAVILSCYPNDRLNTDEIWTPYNFVKTLDCTRDLSGRKNKKIEMVWVKKSDAWEKKYQKLKSDPRLAVFIGGQTEQLKLF